jgi:hypothetical protein
MLIDKEEHEIVNKKFVKIYIVVWLCGKHGRDFFFLLDLKYEIKV